MDIIGICRFSFVGRGDWKAYKGISDQELEQACLRQAAALFSDNRIMTRLSTFEHLTLRSLAAQSDKDFKFLVIASELMPEQYKDKLNDLCREVPQVVVHYAPFTLDTDLGEIIKAQTEALGMGRKTAMQFRLDDDDCVSVDFIRKLREAATSLKSSFDNFAVSFPNVLYVNSSSGAAKAYDWFNPFYGVGVATFHPGRGVYGFGHYKIPERLPSLTVPDVYSLVTHGGTNDTTPQDKIAQRVKAMRLLDNRRTLREILRKHFPFLGAPGLEASGLSSLLA